MNDTQTTYYIDPTIYDGRPRNPEGRLEKELRTYDLLDRLGVSYKRLDHDAKMCIRDSHVRGTSAGIGLKIPQLEQAGAPPALDMRWHVLYI